MDKKDFVNKVLHGDCLEKMKDLPDVPMKNNHPTVKPIKLMSYLITLGSREGDVILDPFTGSGTTLVAAKKLNRKYIGVELNEEYIDIINARLKNVDKSQKKVGDF